MLNSRIARISMLILALIIGNIGFRYVTQAGQGLNVVQNDGYAGTGAALIITSGFILGMLATGPKAKQ